MSFIDFEHSNSPLLFRQPLSDAASLNPRTNSFGWSSPAASPTAQNNRGWPSFSGNSASTSAINSSFCGPRENIQERREVTFQQRERRAQVSLSSDTPELLSPAYQYPENPKEDRHPRRSKDHDRRRNRSPREDKRANLYKTELCRSFEETGVCRYGGKCQFAHGHDEIRPRSQHPRYRTEICKTFHTVGTCPYGKRCRFIHLDGASPLWSSSYFNRFDDDYVDPLKTLEYSLDVDEYFKSLDDPLPLLSTGVSSETHSRREKDFQLEQGGPGESSQSRSQTTTTVSDSDDSSSTGYASSASDHDEEAENRQPATFAVITSAEPKSVKQEKEEEEQGSKQAGTTSDGDEDDEDVDDVTGRRLPIFRIIESHSGNVQAEDAPKANVVSTANKVIDDEDDEYTSSTTVEILSSKLLSHLQLSK